LVRQLKFKFRIIPEHYQQKIDTADEETLMIWSERILEAKKIEEIFEGRSEQ